MEVYLQEVAASTFMTDLDPTTRETILQAMAEFPQILQTSVRFASAHFPEKVWNLLFKQVDQSVESTGQAGRMDAGAPKRSTTTYTQTK